MQVPLILCIAQCAWALLPAVGWGGTVAIQASPQATCSIAGSAQTASGSCAVTCPTAAATIEVLVLSQRVSVEPYSCIPKPTLSSASPAYWYEAVQTNLTITGQGFYDSPAGVLCKFDSAASKGHYLSQNSVQCEWTPLLAGAHAVALSFNRVDWTDSIPVTVKTTPRVVSISSSAVYLPATLTVTGAYLSSGLRCAFSSGLGATLVLSNSNTGTCAVPSQVQGAVTVQVTDSLLIPLSREFHFTYKGRVTLTAVSPSFVLADSRFSLFGVGFDSGMKCGVDGTAVSTLFVAVNQLLCSTNNLPVGAHTVQVLDPDGVDATASPLQLSIQAVSYTLTGSQSANNDTAITASGALPNRVTYCRVGRNLPVKATLVSGGLVCPSSGTRDIGQLCVELSFNDAHDFSRDCQVTVTLKRKTRTLGISPLVFSLSGGDVTVTALRFYPVSTYQCHITLPSGSSQLAPATLTSATELTCTAQPSLVGGLASLSVVQDGHWTLEQFSFTYVTYLTLSSFRPPRVVMGGGTRLTVYGLNIPTPNLCVFTESGGSIYQVDPISVTATEITCVTPALSSEGIVTVSFQDFDGSPSETIEVPVVKAATISAMTPGFAFEARETVLYLTGSDFLDVPELAVRLDISKQPAPAEFLSSTLISATVTVLRTNHFLHSHETVSVSLNGVDFVGAYPLAVYPSPSLGVLSIPKGPWLGEYTITIYGNGFELAGACVFGDSSGTVTPVSYHSAQCQAPLTVPGTYQVAIEVYGTRFTTKPVHFTFMGFSEYTFSPRSGPLSGGTVVTVTGSFVWIEGSDTVACSFGGTLAPATLSGATLTCTSPSHSISETVHLHIVVNGFDYSQPNLPSDLFFYEADPTIGILTTAMWTSVGGTLVEISGSGFQWRSEWMCHFGDLESHLLVLSHTLAVCFSPQTLYGFQDVLKLSANGQYFLVFQNQFAVIPDPSAYSCAPRLGPREGQTTVTITGDYLSSVTLCRFGHRLTVAATVVDRYSVQCVTPPWNYPAEVFVEVSVNAQVFTGSMVRFTYYDLPEVAAVMPRSVPMAGGTVLTIVGAGFLELTLCRINGVISVSVFVSSEEILCTTPSTPEGKIDFELSFNGQQFHSFLKATYTAYAQLSISTIAPSAGVAGTVVSISGTGFIDDGQLSCRFGDVEATWVRLLSSQLLKCEVPLLPAGSVTVAVSVNGVDYTQYESFVVHWELEVVSAYPHYSSPDGGTQVTLNTLNWPTDTSLARCKFAIIDPPTHTSKYISEFQDSFIVTAAVDGRTVKCVAPSNADIGTAKVKVVVTSELQIYSSSGVSVLYIESSFGGFYRQGSNQIECPIGHYCRAESWYAPQPCEVGYWQSHKRQRKCSVCSKGAYCPDRTMSTTIICPAGKICAARGSSAPMYDCRPGFYCVEGTTTTSFWDDSPYGVKQRLCSALGHFCVSGSSDVAQLLPCTVGFYCPYGAKEHHGTVQCLSGYYCIESEVIPCPPRYFCPERGNVVPQLCLPGTFNPFVGQTKCLPCSYGFVCPRAGMLTPQECPLGYICNQEGLSNPTQMCTAGYYCDGLVISGYTERPCREISDLDALSVSFCSEEVMVKKEDPDNISASLPHFSGKLVNMCCWSVKTTGDFIVAIGDGGQWQRAFDRLREESARQSMSGMDLYRLLPGATRRLASARNVSLSPIRPSDVSALSLQLQGLLLMKQPQPCPAGMFCLAKTGSSSLVGSLPPYECNPGTYCRLAASSPQGTGLCSAGYYCPAGSSAPIQTQPGYRAEQQGNVNPAPCMPGYFSNQAAAASCQVCPSGYECPSSGTVWPSICQPGQYRSAGNMSRCIPCPARTWTYEKGVTAPLFCLPCTPGRLCSQPGIHAVAQTYPCIEGDICREAADLKSRDGCPAGYLCKMDTAPYEAYDIECIEGFFCKFRTPYRNKYLLQCPAFSYCPPASPDYEIFYVTDHTTYTGDLPPTMCPIGTGQDGKAGKKELRDCSVNAEYGESAEPRKYLLELNPVNVTLGTPPTAFVETGNHTFAEQLPYYALESFDTALITIDLRHIDTANSMLRYGMGWTIAVTITVGSIADRQGASPVDMPLTFLSTSVEKNTVLEFSVEAWQPLFLTVSILLFNGLILSERESFLNTASVEIFKPERANYGTRDVFVAYFDSTVALPVNVPADVSSTMPDFILSFAESPRRYREAATPRIEGLNSFTPNSLFWQGSSLTAVTYLPFFSNCKGYGAHISLWALFELSAGCDLVAPENTTYVSSFDFGALPHADSCKNITIECIYDEVPNKQEPLPRWWEIPYDTYVFYLSESPLSPEDFLSGVGGNQVPVNVANLNAGQGLPHTVTLDVRYQQLDVNTKKIITATLTYDDFQEPTSDQNSGAAIIKYNLVVNFSALSHTELMILFQFPVSFYSVLNLIIGSVMVACCFTFLVYHRVVTKASPVPRIKFWGYIVMTIPPLFVGIVLAVLPIYVVLLFVSIFVQGNIWTEVITFPDTDVDQKTRMGIFDSITPLYDVLSVGDMTVNRYCRIGVSLMLVALYLLGVSSALFLPYSRRQQSSLYQVDPKGNILHSVYWRRFSFLFLSLMTTCGCLMLVFFSYSDYFAKNVYPCVAALQFMGWVYEEMMEPLIGSALMKAPLMAAIAVVQGLCTFGAANFVDFLQASFVDFSIMLYNRVYNEDNVQAVSGLIKAAFKQVKQIVKERGVVHSKPLVSESHAATVDQQHTEVGPTPRTERPPTLEAELSDYSLPSIEESDSLSYYTVEEVRESPPPSEHPQDIILEQDVEPLLEAFGGYAADTLGNVYNIVIITFLWYFYDSTQIAATYGIDTNAIPLYFLFAVMIVPFQLVMDTLLHNCNEYFNGWAIHDFLDHLSLRFKSRTTRWAVLDTQNVDFVEEDQRSIYLTCFSSQFYFMCTIHCSGMILLLMGIHTLIVNDTYNIFQDRALLAIIPFVLVLCALVHTGSYYLGLALQLWRVPSGEKKQPPADPDQNFRELVEAFMQTRQPAHTQVVPAIQNWTQVDLVKAGDEVIRRELNSDNLTKDKVRRMFLAENREWLQHNLQYILTGNSLKKYRGLLLEKFREMFGGVSPPLSERTYSEMSSQEEVEPLSHSSLQVVRYWVSRAQRIHLLRSQLQSLIASKHKERCLYCDTPSALQSELIESIEDLFFRFKSAQKAPANFQMDIWDAGEWLEFVEAEGHFRTLCLSCLALCDQFNSDAAKMRRKLLPEALQRRRRAINFTDAPKDLELPLRDIVRKWLSAARSRLRQSP